MSYHTLLPFIHHLWKKSNVNDNFKFSNGAPWNVFTSCHIILRLITLSHNLSLMFDTKVISMGTLNLVHRLLKILKHLATSHHMFSHLITLYPYLWWKSNANDNFKLSTQTLWKAITSCNILLLLIKPLSPMFNRKPISMRHLSLVPRLLEILSHLATSHHMLSHLITLYPPSSMEK